MDPIIPEGLVGLTTSEVEKKKKQGLSNIQPQKLSKSIGRIISDNILTLFNALNVGLALLVLFAGSYRNLLFFFTVLFNVGIGIFQEVRAKMTIEKLSIISEPLVKVVRDGCVSEIHMEELVQDDVMLLTSGSQICADAIVVNGTVEVNEALLTGESDAVYKKEGANLMSGSFVVAGQCYAKVVSVGAENYSYKLVENATKHKKFNSMLMNELNKILKFVGFVIVPLGILLYLSMTLLGKVAPKIAMVSTAGALIGMIPQGLILLTSMALSVGTIKLAGMKVLVQELYGIESLARVNVLCLDKTGTITEGKLKVDEVVSLQYLNEVASDDDTNDNDLTDKDNALAKIIEELALFAKIIEDDNLSINAIREFVESTGQVVDKEAIARAKKADLISTLPFSSERKMSLISVKESAELPIRGEYILGAPEAMLSYAENVDKTDEAVASAIRKVCNKYTFLGKRVLLFAHTNDIALASSKWTFLSLCVMSDNVRESVGEVLEYFKQQDVDIYIFSGDNPVTIARIAEKAGLKIAGSGATNAASALTGAALTADSKKSGNAEAPAQVGAAPADGSEMGTLFAVDASQLESVDEMREALGKYRIFGRVSPEQKAELVKLLRAEGKAVAMTGDGVNDVMALRAADCGIAMAGGAAAVRSVANIVLLEDNIDGLPAVIAEGRRVINNICRSASLYLVKTIFSVFLATAFLLVGRAYPFQPIHLTLISSAAVGFPTFFLSMEPNSERISGHFLRQVIVRALPGSLTISLNMLILTFIYKLLGLSHEDYFTLCVLLTGGVYFIILFVVCFPFNKWRAAVFATSLTIFVVCFLFFKDIFLLTAVTPTILFSFLVLFGFSVLVFWFLHKVLATYFLSSRE